MHRSAVGRPWILLAVLAVGVAAGVRVLAQVGVGAAAAPVTDESPGRNRVYPPTDRTLSRGMRREESIASGEFAQAMTFLDDVLGKNEDYFTETGAEGGYAGLKETARRLIRDLPAEGRRAYESTYGPVAERMLKTAVSAGDAAGLQAVAQRYFYTPAGYQAVMLLATDEADAGRHLSAALLYQQLLDTPAAVRLHDPALSVRAAASWLAAEDPDRAKRVLEALASRGRQNVEVAGRDFAIDAGADPLQWLRNTVGEPVDATREPEAQWLTYRGNAARNGETVGGLPHMRGRWRVELLYPYTRLEELFREYNAQLVKSDHATPIANVPLAVGDTIVVRRPEGLLAIDFRTGKRIWRTELQRDTQLETLIKSGSSSEEDAANAEAARSFARRIWDDYLYNTMSSDGQRIYAIRDLPMPSAQDFEVSPFMNPSGAEASAPTNRLSAFELASEGSLVWEIDGGSANNELSGAFFLGAPLSVGSSLFTLVEIRDDIYLAALDSATGAPQWRQQLANLESGVVLDLRRRLQAAMPSYDEGVLVCPTGAGVVVGVDLAKRSLAWAYRYETLPPIDGVYRGGPDEAQQDQAGHWTDCAAMIANGRVLLTPPESSELHCLDLRTGKLLWKQPRGEMQRLACVVDERILLVGPHKLTSLKLADGTPAWANSETALPRGAAPAGNGFVSEGKYFFPLTTAEVVGVDLGSGAIVSRVRSRDGAPLGNLICHRGTVISQNGRYLDCFDQIDALRNRSEQQLAKDADNVEALRSLGEIAFNEGRVSEAISLAERAYRAGPDELETRDMLAECLAEALDEDFATYRPKLPLLKELEGGGAVNRVQVLRIEAHGLLEAGDRLGSAAACFELYRAADAAFEPLTIRRDHETLVSRWVAAQMAAIWDAAPEAERATLSEQMRKLAPQDGAGAPGDELERFLAFFGALPDADALKLAHAAQLVKDHRGLEAQQLLLDLAKSPDAAVRREAVARLATQLHDLHLHRSAHEFDVRLAGEFADEPCLDGLTGRQLVASWAEADAAATVKWPTGKVDIHTVGAGGGAVAARARAPVWTVRLEHADSILASGAGFFAGRGAELTWQDGYGREFFTARPELEAQAVYRQTGSVYGSSRGNLLVVSLGRELAAFNTQATADGQSPALVWRASLGSNFDYQDTYLEEIARSADRRPGSHRAPRMTLDGKWIGVIGPIGSGGCIFQDQRRLMCVDPATGEVLWSRTDSPAGCDLFGDDRYLFATPTGSDTAKVYSAIDGRSLGEARLPAWDDQLSTRGRLVICWRRLEDGHCELSAVDPLAKETVWRQTFEADSQVDADADRFIAVVEPQGRAAIVDSSTGAVVLEQVLPRQPRMAALHLSVGADDFTLVVEHAVARNTDREVRPFNGGDSPVVDGDVIVLNRAAGRMNWARPAKVLRQVLLLDQPPDLPFVTFAGTLAATGASEERGTMTLLLIDKATGRTLLSTDDIPQAGAAYCLPRVTDAARREVTVELPARSLVLQFTEGRRPPDPPALADVESAAGKVSRGLMGIFRNIGGSE